MAQKVATIDDDVQDMLNNLDNLMSSQSFGTPRMALSKLYSNTGKTPSVPVDVHRTPLKDQDLDELLKSIDQSISTDPNSSKNTEQFVGKCSVVSVSGAVSACSHLRCTMCDHEVVRILNRSWDPSCDYFFFRSKTPGRLFELIDSIRFSRICLSMFMDNCKQTNDNRIWIRT
uniref:Cilia- and flagella-associated protein 418 n=1 Tax=Spongospora subterranea TaxID=70186 RepID=A0A0H5QM39_9EUKA|eukprot:CRZ02431.1 hypothetical protein [Spongospora subterranea]